MHARKAQSATEYLMTYGWAILAIAAVGGLLYIYVFSERDCTNGASGFPLVGAVVPSGNEYSVNADGSATILFHNQMDKNVSVTKVNSVGITSVSIDAGEKAAVSTGAGTMRSGKIGKCYSLPITIEYNTDRITGVKSAGILNGRYG